MMTDSQIFEKFAECVGRCIESMSVVTPRPNGEYTESFIQFIDPCKLTDELLIVANEERPITRK